MPNDVGSVRTALVTAVEAIGVTKLGFDTGHVNIKSYLLSDEITEKIVDYLLTQVDGEPLVRAWAFRVDADEEIIAAGGKLQRNYQITCEGYYGVDGETPVNLILEHASKVKEAIVGMGIDMSDTVSSRLEMGAVSVERETLSQSGTSDIYIARFIINAFSADTLDW